MIDLHTHIMPFIDDGSDSIEMTKKMLEMEIENGVTDVVLTPHMVKGKVKSIEEYQKYSRDCWGEYTYLFRAGEWLVLEYDDAELKPVKDYL